MTLSVTEVPICHCTAVTRRQCHHPKVRFRGRCSTATRATGQAGSCSGTALPWRLPVFFCPRTKLRSLLQDSPAAGLGIVSPSVKARTGGSADLMNFYATSYAVAYGRGSRSPPQRCAGARSHD